ncbi:hypothetical protein EWN38_11895, partial [Salmonella enterica]|nr:hypothetical protein [Salmonella enterica]EBA3327197.1 hypothetical protein [Salmonella enterica]
CGVDSILMTRNVVIDRYIKNYIGEAMKRIVKFFLAMLLGIIVNMVAAPAMAYNCISSGESSEDCEAQCNMFWLYGEFAYWTCF